MAARANPLTRVQILTIRVRAEKGENRGKLAAEFDRTESYINSIVRGKVRLDVPLVGNPTTRWHEARAKSNDIDAEIERLFHEGKEQTEMVEILGLNTRSSVTKALKRLGLSCRDRNRAARDRAEPIVIKLFHENKSLVEISKSTNLTSKQVQTILKKHDLSFRRRNSVLAHQEKVARRKHHEAQLLSDEQKARRLRAFIAHIDAGRPKTQFEFYSWLRKNKLLTREACQQVINGVSTE